MLHGARQRETLWSFCQMSFVVAVNSFFFVYTNLLLRLKTEAGGALSREETFCHRQQSHWTSMLFVRLLRCTPHTKLCRSNLLLTDQPDDVDSSSTSWAPSLEKALCLSWGLPGQGNGGGRGSHLRWWRRFSRWRQWREALRLLEQCLPQCHSRREPHAGRSSTAALHPLVWRARECETGEEEIAQLKFLLCV